MPEGAATAEAGQPSSRATLGLTGLTINAMALIAPGAFLWLTFQIQSLYGAPMAGSAMWFGILAALLLCFATAISYAELSKLYPGRRLVVLLRRAGLPLARPRPSSSPASPSSSPAGRATSTTGSTRACMVGVTAILSGYLLNQFLPDTFSGTYQQPALHVPLLRRLRVRRGLHRLPRRDRHDRRQRGHQRHPDHRAAGLLGDGHRLPRRSTREGSTGCHLVNGVPVDYVVAQEPVIENGKPKLDATRRAGHAEQDGRRRQRRSPEMKDGKPVPVHPQLRRRPGRHAWSRSTPTTPRTSTPHFKFHPTASSVVAPHGFSFIFIQACIAILILVGFESVTSMGEEAKNAKRDIPRAVLLSLVHPGRRLLPDRVLRRQLLPQPGLHAWPTRAPRARRSAT